MKLLPLALLALAPIAALVLLFSEEDPDVVSRAGAPATVVAESVAPVAAALERNRAPTVPDAGVLQSPDPATGRDRPRRWERRLVDQFLSDMERKGATEAPEIDPRPVPEEASADFAAGFRAALAEHERTDP
jgi:hypothetical protein